MNRRRAISASLVALILILSLLWLLPSGEDEQRNQASLPSVAVQTNGTTRRTPKSPPLVNTNARLQVQPASEDRGVWQRKMDNEDPYWDFKLPISFYGKVMDDQGQPIAGASVEFVWTDLSSEGTGKKTTESDSNGLFSLTGATGKGLSVYVSKAGYQRYRSKSINKASFDYSPLASPGTYHKPDPMSPVLFVMHKNRPKEALLQINRRFPSSTNQPTVFYLDGNDTSAVRIDLLENRSETNGQEGAWMLRVSVPSGGIQISTNEFPFEAPETGYEPSILLDRKTAKPETWAYPYQGGEFFVRTSSGYGRMRLQMLEGSPHLSINSFYNPNNSRNLEP